MNVKKEEKSEGDDVVIIEPSSAARVKQETKPTTLEPSKKTKIAKKVVKSSSGSSVSKHSVAGGKKKKKTKGKTASESTLTMFDLIKEKGMIPSRGGGRPGRDERELLRFYEHFGKISKPGTQWKWKTSDPELALDREILEKFKSGLRPPSNFRKFNGVWQEKQWAIYNLE